MMKMILQQAKAATTAAARFANFVLRGRWIRPPLLSLFFAASLLLPAFVLSSARAEDNAKDNNPPVVVVAFGDSLSSGYGLEMPEVYGFAPQLQEQLLMMGLNATVIKSAVPGEISAEGLNRTDWMLEYKPDIVVVEYGANDMLRGLPVAPMRENLDAIIVKIKQSGAKVLIAGMYATANNGEEYQQQFNNTYPALAKKHDVMLYPFFLEGVFGNPQYFQQGDDKHPNAQGTTIIAKNIAPLVIKLAKTLTKE